MEGAIRKLFTLLRLKQRTLRGLLRRRCQEEGGFENCAVWRPQIEDFMQFLLNFQNSLEENAISLAGMVFGSQLQSILFAYSALFSSNGGKKS